MKKFLLGILLIAQLLPCTACGSKDTALSWQEQYDLGMRYLSDGNYEEAIIAFTAAIEINPKQADAYLGRADAYMNAGTIEDDLALALSDYETILTLDETCVDAYLGMAEIYITRGEWDKAEAILNTGYDKTGDVRLSNRLGELAGDKIMDYWGRPVRESTYDGSGILLYYLEYTYRTGGYSWKYDTATSYDGNGIQTGYVKCEYDEAGKLVRGFNQINNVICLSINTYDDDGDKIRSDWYDENGSPDGYTLYEHDDTGRWEKTSYYGADGELCQADIIEFSEDWTYQKTTMLHYFDGESTDYQVVEWERGLKIRDAHYDANGTMTSYSTAEHNEAGNLICECIYDGDGALLRRFVYSYDADGNRTVSYDYDGEGDLISSTVYE